MERDGEAVDWAAEAERLAAEFFDALQRMYIRAGEPPLRAVAARNNRLSASNLSALLSGKRTTLPNYEVMAAAVSALLHEAPAAEKERELARWRERWTEARYARKQAQKTSAQTVEQARLEAEAIVAQARATADDLMKRARMDVDTATAMRAEADRTLSDARSEAELILEDARYKAGRLEAAAESKAESIIATAIAEAERGRKAADDVLEVAKNKAEAIRALAKLDAEDIVWTGVSVPGARRPDRRRVAEFERQDTSYGPGAKIPLDLIARLFRQLPSDVRPEHEG